MTKELSRSQQRRKIEQYNKNKSTFYKALNKKELEDFAHAILHLTERMDTDFDDWAILAGIYKTMKANQKEMKK